MGLDIIIYREELTSHPDKEDITVIEREEFWFSQSWEIGALFAVRFGVDLNQMIWTSHSDIAEHASSALSEDFKSLCEDEIEELKELIELCEEKTEDNASYTLILDY